MGLAAMNDEEKAFHRAILDRPDDPALMLIYADWLEGRGAIEQAALMRIATQLEVSIFKFYSATIRGARGRRRRRHRYRYDVTAPSPEHPHVSAGLVALVTRHEIGPPHRIDRFWVRADGMTDANEQWWGWLLALALAHGWELPTSEPTMTA